MFFGKFPGGKITFPTNITNKIVNNKHMFEISEDIFAIKKSRVLVDNFANVKCLIKPLEFLYISISILLI